jgi:predicted HicB family RNase H-like nuclease
MPKLKLAGLTGTAEYSEKTDSWRGKILNVADLVTYQAESLERLKGKFVLAVMNYIEELEIRKNG